MRQVNALHATPAQHIRANLRMICARQRPTASTPHSITGYVPYGASHAGACCGSLVSGVHTAAACLLLVQPASACNLDLVDNPIVEHSVKAQSQRHHHSQLPVFAFLQPPTAPDVAHDQLHQQLQQLSLPSQYPASQLTQPSSLSSAAATATALSNAADQGDLAVALISSDTIWYPLLLSTVAGLSTSVGGIIAVSLSTDDSTLAFLLGAALGVMITVSVIELWVHTAAELHDPLGITAAVAAGAAVFALLDASLPDGQDMSHSSSKHHQHHLYMGSRKTDKALGCEQQQQRWQQDYDTDRQLVSIQGNSSSSNQRVQIADKNATNQQQQQQQAVDKMQLPIASSSSGSSSSSTGSWTRSHPSDLWRLGLLMSVTLTLHNLPEGFAVAFSAYTDIGPVMTLAIALHNIPEGLVIAAPVYAASGNRWQALGLATASGLSEPLGAAAALLAAKPFVNNMQQLDYLLAATGGVMIAVCVLELWPEGRKCGRDSQMIQGILLGSVIMGWTLYVGV